MDSIVQQNAANAERSASASEEMNTLAEQIKSVVDQLTALVGERGINSDRSVKKSPPHPLHNTFPVTAKIGSTQPGIVPKRTKIQPEQIIPMDDDFTYF